MAEPRFGFATKALIKKGGKYLLLYKSESEEINPNSYDIPGGRLKFGEKPAEALTREVEEETGLKVEPIKISEIWTFTKEDFQLIGATYFCEYISGQENLSAEHSNFKWVSPDQIITSDEYPKWLKDTIELAENLF